MPGFYLKNQLPWGGCDYLKRAPEQVMTRLTDDKTR
jgi:hypothetical protein